MARSGKYRVLTGQQGHPLAGPNGGVMEHRAVLYDKIGPGQHPCHHCGTVVEWGLDLHVDHLDDDPLNNDPDNLVPSCFPCNIHRTQRERPLCPRGHERTPENTYTDKRGYHSCYPCRLEKSREQWQRKKAFCG